MYSLILNELNFVPYKIIAGMYLLRVTISFFGSATVYLHKFLKIIKLSCYLNGIIDDRVWLFNIGIIIT